MGLLYGSDPGAWAVYQGDYKLIDHRRVSLYDLSRDAGERRDLSQWRPEVVRAMKLHQPVIESSGLRVDPSESERAQLRALGYQLPDEESP